MRKTYNEGRREKILLKDILIPAGTIFSEAPTNIQLDAREFVETTIGLTKNTAGFFVYQISEESEELFKEV